VIGGGFAGMTAALQLAEQGLAVTLVEKEVAIGGFFPLLDNTFPTNSCGVCFLSPKQPAYCNLFRRRTIGWRYRFSLTWAGKTDHPL